MSPTGCRGWRLKGRWDVTQARGPQLGADRGWETTPPPPDQAVPGSVPVCAQPPRSPH